MKLSFRYIGESYNVGEFYFEGREIDAFSDNAIFGIDPGEEKEIVFRIPKGIEFDEEYYDTKDLIVDYNMRFYKFRKNDRSLLFGVASTGGTMFLGNNN